jgi:hypothetical protein
MARERTRLAARHPAGWRAPDDCRALPGASIDPRCCQSPRRSRFACRRVHDAWRTRCPAQAHVETAALAPTPDSRPSPDESLDDSRLHEALSTGLGALDEEAGTAVLLRYQQGSRMPCPGQVRLDRDLCRHASAAFARRRDATVTLVRPAGSVNQWAAAAGAPPSMIGTCAATEPSRERLRAQRLRDAVAIDLAEDQGYPSPRSRSRQLARSWAGSTSGRSAITCARSWSRKLGSRSQRSSRLASPAASPTSK